MLNRFVRHASPIATAALTMASLALPAQSPRLTIYADQPTHAVSPTLYGLMTEEINYSYDGGLYAEMVRNRTFRSDWSGVPYWVLVEKGDAEAKIAPDHATGPSEALKESMKLEVKQASAASPAGLLNSGWWGMAIKPESSYQGSFYAKVGDDPGPVTVSLVSDATGTVLASAKVNGVGTEWKQYAFTLKTGAIDVPALPIHTRAANANSSTAANHLEITVERPGTLWLQMVSLFPPTYHDRPNGNRVDLMEKMAAMQPKFLRFPGGNYLEGNRMADWFDWKKTIGPLVDRPTHPSPWSYHSSDGMGLLEFLEWCEDLKMQPVLAVYAGYSLNGEHVAAGPNLEKYVQSALDEIEYVTGSTATKWGAVRASNGHPAPFALTYVEIGNEDQFDKSGSYDGRFAQFYKEIKAKYPQLQLIATTPVKSVKPDVVDEHFYVRATENFHDAAHYDKTDRNGPKIFVGEWATREGTPTPNMGAALGDAAWMTGMERNSDLIIMASYAPLFVNVNPGGMQWDTDLIGYNTLTSYGSPSYWAQVLFSSNLGTEVVAASLESAGPRIYTSVTRNAAKHKLYIKLVNATSEAKSFTIALNGAAAKHEAKLITLSGKSPNATNSITHPDAIVPVEKPLAISGTEIRHTFEPYSINVIDLDY